MENFVILIPSYKNERWCVQNIESALSQEYSNFRIVFVDDCSPDNTFEKVKSYVKDSPNAKKPPLKYGISLIRNSQRLGAMENLYNMVHSCDDNEVVITLDGDDKLAHKNVLSKLNEVYSSGEVWMTYGSYKGSDGHIGCCKPYEKNIIESNAFRNVPWRASHLRTFYAGLFKKIKKEDLYGPEGNFLDMAWDCGFQFPMLEMSGDNFRFISDILYIYNIDNPISDFRVNVARQGMLDGFIRRKPKYQRLPCKTW